jgi:hypothetical protein
MTFISIEDCGRGLECPIHYRVQDHQTDGVISLIDYVGEYAVHTHEVNPSEALWALATGEAIFDFHVKVYRVGENGTLAELADDLDRFTLNVIRSENHYIPEPDESMTDGQIEEFILDQIRAAHEITIGLIKAGVISA